MNPICKIWAHKWNDVDEIVRTGFGKCALCGFVLDLQDEDTKDKSFNLDGRLWLMRFRIKKWFYLKTRHFQKCDDCGKRLGKHDENCAPF